MKKRFKRAGVAVLSIAMLLSMGAMAVPVSASVLPTNSKISLKGALGSYKLYQIASSKTENEATAYTVNEAYKDVLKVTGGYVVDAAGKKLKDMTDHGSEIEAVAKALSEKVPATADGSFDITDVNTAVDFNIGGANGLGSGIYLIVGTSSGKTQPILFDIEPSDTDVRTKNIEVKYSDVTFVKEITKITNKYSEDDKIGKDKGGNNGGTGIAEIGGTVTYRLTTSFPNYDEDVSALGHHFTITDIPEDSIIIKNSTIKVFVDGKQLGEDGASADGQFTLTTKDITEASVGADYKEATDNFVKTVTTDGIGFQVVFDDKYVLANGGSSVAVEFDATVGLTADIVGDADTTDNSNDNGATLSYSNNYFTGVGSITYDENTGKPKEENPDNPKVIPDDAMVFCSLFTVNKFDTSDQELSGAVFELYKGDTVNASELLGTIGEGKSLSKFVFNGLGEGVYTLHEKTAPAGYGKANDVVFEIKGVKDGSVGYYVDSFQFVNKSNNDTEFNGTLKVEDPPTQTLPGTGGIGTYLFTICGAAFVLLAGVLFVIYMKKRKTEE